MPPRLLDADRDYPPEPLDGCAGLLVTVLLCVAVAVLVGVLWLFVVSL